MDAQKTVGEHAALEIGADFALDESGDGRSLRSRSDEKGHELRANDFVEKGVLGLVAGVFGDDEASAGTGTQRRGDRSRAFRLAASSTSRVRASTQGCEGRSAECNPDRRGPRPRHRYAWSNAE